MKRNIFSSLHSNAMFWYRSPERTIRCYRTTCTWKSESMCVIIRIISTWWIHIHASVRVYRCTHRRHQVRFKCTKRTDKWAPCCGLNADYDNIYSTTVQFRAENCLTHTFLLYCAQKLRGGTYTSCLYGLHCETVVTGADRGRLAPQRYTLEFCISQSVVLLDLSYNAHSNWAQ